uniref:Protein panstrongylus lignarius n=1 Tax=Rhodnius prolixus TaxID=13249 RepID=A0A4P6DAV3_RHOPR
MARTGKLILDRLHKAFVLACFTTTIVGLGVIGVRGANYFLYVYPQIKAQRAKDEENLLLEGKPEDILPDSATILKD